MDEQQKSHQSLGAHTGAGVCIYKIMSFQRLANGRLVSCGDDVLKTLKPISERGSTYQAKRCREILQQIFNYARALELCETNPAEAIQYVPAMKTHQVNTTVHWNLVRWAIC